MANVAPAQTAPQTTAEYEAEFELLMQEATRINELMATDRVEIERLKIETKILAEETSRLKAETRTLLVGLGVKF